MNDELTIDAYALEDDNQEDAPMIILDLQDAWLWYDIADDVLDNDPCVYDIATMGMVSDAPAMASGVSDAYVII